MNEKGVGINCSKIEKLIKVLFIKDYTDTMGNNLLRAMYRQLRILKKED